MFHVFLDSLYSNSPTSFSIAYPRKMRFPCLCFFYKSCERKTIPLILSPESQVTLTILSTLRPLYHNPHSHSLQFTKIYHISYKCIYSLQLYVYLYIFRPLFHNPHFPITILTTTKLIGQGKKNARCVWHQKLFLLFMTHLFYWGKNGKLVAGVMLTKRLCLISSSRPPHIVKIENCKSVYWIPRPK